MILVARPVTFCSFSGSWLETQLFLTKFDLLEEKPSFGGLFFWRDLVFTLAAQFWDC